jgi:Caspase domain
MPELAAGQGRRALLVGVNEYPKLAPRYRLHGCVNDVEAMAHILETVAGFPRDNITLLRDQEATRDRILEELDRLTDQSAPGDIVVFHFSGHGSQMTDREGDEADGLDETIVPYDSGRRPYPNRDITDDELYEWLRGLTEKTDNVVVIADCCHSGTNTRDLFGEPSRWVEPDDRPIEELPPSPFGPEAAAALRGGSRDLGASGWLPLGKRYVVIAGCQDDESSYELDAPDDPQLKHGALTYFLTAEMARAKPGATYLDVFEKVSVQVTARYPRQHPQLEGTRDRELFGVRDLQPMRYVAVSGRSGQTVTLAAGAAHGMTRGSQWTVYPPGTQRVDDQARPLGRVTVTAVRAVDADASIDEEGDRIGAGARAVETLRPIAEPRLAVEVVAPSGHDAAKQALLRALQSSQLVEASSDAGGIGVRAYVIPARSGAGEDDPVPQLGQLSKAVWAVVGKDGRLIMPVHRVDEFNVENILLQNLESLVRYRRLLALANPNLDSALKGRIEVTLLRRSGNGWEEATPDPAGGRVVFEEGDQFAIRVVNRHTGPVWVAVLDFGLTGRIDLVHPSAGPSERVDPPTARSPGNRLEIGMRAGSELYLGFPENFPYVKDPTDTKPDAGVEVFKVFATTGRPVDFSYMLQGSFRGLREEEEEEESELEQVLTETLAPGTRDVRRPQGPVATDQDWTTVDLPFELRRVRQEPASG